MLAELEIENLAVIAHARIPFSPHLNVFTGETGAGKSILIHGIHAVLGQRVTRDIVRTGCKKAVITALFTKLSPAVCAKLDALSISHEDDELLLTREIAADGGSAARVNGHTTTVSVLREIGSTLINIHGQHDNQVLLSPECHLQILDAFGGDDTRLHRYQESFRALQQTAKRLNHLGKLEQEKAHRRQYLRQLVQDVEDLGLEAGEESALEEELELLQHVGGISSALQNAEELLSGEESGGTAVDRTEEAAEELSAIAELRSDFSALYERLNTVRIEVEDIAAECRNLREQLDMDPARYAQVTKRLQEIRALGKQYQCTGDELMQQYQQAEEELQQMQGDAAEIEALREEKKQLLEQVSTQAKELSEYRAQLLERFAAQVTEQLAFLNMPNVVLTGKHTMGKLTIHGMDNLEFLISANRGEEPRPLARIASGGELSRIMLALKCVIADRDSIPTLIFDEIDTGVSGKAAQKIGMKLREVGQLRQVLCVTHLSQIAVMADHHLMIEKQTDCGRTETHVMPLTEEGRIREIARIMGGENPSELLLRSAQEELERWHPLPEKGAQEL
ncbi:DNA repair protein RecN [uncultured Ruminococcus sp.]|uniref:DNA repair protein RecN n=1 Tax=uncultured Ruminococcus sp. TaxID=165186 RepID=UPI00266F92D1|nr:DNA repair protein RecN [uncultured Ruminococcus sp.]